MYVRAVRKKPSPKCLWFSYYMARDLPTALMLPPGTHSCTGVLHEARSYAIDLRGAACY